MFRAIQADQHRLLQLTGESAALPGGPVGKRRERIVGNGIAVAEAVAQSARLDHKCIASLEATIARSCRT
jgi:hypothetical protein